VEADSGNGYAPGAMGYALDDDDDDDN